MLSRHRNSEASAARSKMRSARRQLLEALRSATLALAAGAIFWPTSAAFAQDKEPQRLFRGGLIQQLRSLTEDTPTSKPEPRTTSAPKTKNSERATENPNIPRPRPVGDTQRGGTPTESRTANLQASKATSGKSSQPIGPSDNAALGRFTDQPIRSQDMYSTKEAISNKAAAISSDAAKASRAAEMGVPVTNLKLANEARFQLNDKSEPTGYSANSKYDSAKAKAMAATEDNRKVFNEPTAVLAVENMSQAPKVSRRPLPVGSNTAAKVTQQPTQQTDAPKPTAEPKRVASAPQSTSQPTAQQPDAPVPTGLKPMGSSYALEQPDAPESGKSNAEAPEYPSLQTPSFAAPGAPHVKRTAPPSGSAASSQPKLPQFPAPPANLNAPSSSTSNANSNSTSMRSQTPGQSALPNNATMPLPPSLPPAPLAPAQLPPAPQLTPQFAPQSTSQVPRPTFADPKQTQPTQSQPTQLPQATPPSSTGSSHDLQTSAPRALNPIRSNSAPAQDEHMTMETPRLQVLLKGPQDMPVGTAADYQVMVRNVDDIPLDGVILRLEIPNGVAITQGKPSHGELQTERTPDGATLVTWSFTDLAAYQNAFAPIQLTAKSPRNFGVAMEWTLLPKSGEAQFEVRQARLELALEGPSEVEFGVANSYRLHVRNPGSAAAKNVRVKLGAASFGASETVIDEILAGEQQSIDVELTFNERGTINISAEALAAELQSAANIDVLVKQALVTASISGSERVYHGSPSMYEVRVQNAGDLDAKLVKAELAIPEGAEVLTKPDGAKVMGHLLTWDVPNVKAGETVAFPVELNLWTAGEHRLALACKTERGAPSVSTIATVVEAIADLKLVINDPIAPAPVGGTVTYEMSITNRGSQAASNVRAVAQFSDGIEPTKADGHEHRILTGQVIFDPIVRIEAGETKIVRVQARAATEGTHRFRAEIRSDETEVRLVQEETTQYLQSASRMARPANSGSVIR